MFLLSYRKLRVLTSFHMCAQGDAQIWVQPEAQGHSHMDKSPSGSRDKGPRLADSPHRQLKSPQPLASSLFSMSPGEAARVPGARWVPPHRGDVCSAASTPTSGGEVGRTFISFQVSIKVIWRERREITTGFIC